MVRVLAGSFLCLAALSRAYPAAAQPAIDEARRLADRAEFEQALQVLEGAEAGNDLVAEGVVPLLRLRAIAEFALGSDRALGRDLARLAALGWQPPADDVLLPPALLQRYADVRQRVTPLGVSVEVERGAGAVRLSASLRGDVDGLVRAVRFHTRLAGGSWLTSDGREARALTPDESTVEYFAEVLGPGGAVLVHEGSETDPLAVRPLAIEDQGFDRGSRRAGRVHRGSNAPRLGRALDRRVARDHRRRRRGRRRHRHRAGSRRVFQLRHQRPRHAHGELAVTSTPVRDEPAPTEPSLIGRYRLCFEIASGGMATVFLARAEGPSGFEKLVALKRIHPQLAKDSGIVHMFLDEARIASRISHANVCTVFDYGVEGDISFIAMEYLTGEPISRVLRGLHDAPAELRRPWPRIAARICADLCEGMHSAHELRDERNEPLNVVHRDISPENLFVTYDGIAKIVDFGIASARHRIHHTSTGELKGKHAYMAPEQLTEAPIDRRTDVWALGVVLWESLTLRRLFRKRSRAETLFAVVSAPIPAPSSVAPDLPRELDRIVLRCLARDPDDRYPTARELGRDLTRWLGTQNEVVGLADVADWMTRLFPGEAERKRQLVELARAPRGSDGVPRVGAAPEPSGDSTAVHSEVRTTRRWWRRRGLVLSTALAVVLVGAAFVASSALFGGAGAGGSHGGNDARPPAARDPVHEASPPHGEEAAVPPPSDTASDVVDPAEDSDQVPATGETGARTGVASGRRGRGCVAIATPGGWAVVLERGRRLGQTPSRICLPAGRHLLTVQHLGRAPGKRVVVRIEAGETTRLVVDPG